MARKGWVGVADGSVCGMEPRSTIEKAGNKDFWKTGQNAEK